MQDIISTQQNVILHVRDGHPIAATITNGSIKLNELQEMNRGQVEAFYGADKTEIYNALKTY